MAKVVELREKPGRPAQGADGNPVRQATRLVVRRTAWLDLEIDRELRQVIARDGLTYSGVVQDALREYLAEKAS